MSDSCTSLLCPTTESISSLALSKMFGLLMSSASAHSMVTAEVSVPAANMSCAMQKFAFLYLFLILCHDIA
jgi:hypothetical protein